MEAFSRYIPLEEAAFICYRACYSLEMPKLPRRVGKPAVVPSKPQSVATKNYWSPLKVSYAVSVSCRVEQGRRLPTVNQAIAVAQTTDVNAMSMMALNQILRTWRQHHRPLFRKREWRRVDTAERTRENHVADEA